MCKKKLSVDFGMKLKNFEKLNENFTRAKCYVLSLGKNQNKSYFGQDAVDKAYPSLAFVPVVGHLMTTEDGKHYLGGHDYKLNLETLELESMCVPFGVAIPSETPNYESVVENGNISTYLTSDVILWTGRYPELNDAVYSDSIMFGQSMEIFFEESEPLQEDNSYTNITSFTFDALCLLNKSDDAKFNVEPCFPNASIVKADYSAIKDDFNQAFEEMKNELKMYFSTIGGNDLDGNTNINEESKPIVCFSATYNKRRDALRNALDGMNKKDCDAQGEIVCETYYWLMDFADDYALVEKSIWNEEGYTRTNWKIGYEYDEENSVATFVGEAEEVTCEWLTADDKAKLAEAQTKKEQEIVAQFTDTIDEMKSEYEEIVNSFNETKSNFETLEGELNTLREYKATREAEDRKAGEDAIFARFDEKLGKIETYVAFKADAEKVASMSLEDIEEKCFAIAGKYQLTTINTNDVAEDTEEKLTFAKTLVDGTSQFDDVDVEVPAYGGLVEEYRERINK